MSFWKWFRIVGTILVVVVVVGIFFLATSSSDLPDGARTPSAHKSQKFNF